MSIPFSQNQSICNKKDIPKEIINEYKLTDKYFDQDGYAMVEVMKAIYRLPQSGRLAHKDLKAHLAQ